MQSRAVTLGSDGYFRRGGRHVFPVGVNYWPASCGVDLWAEWPAAEVQHDLDVVRDLGLNCVRFFLRWPDFEPEQGKFNEVMFERLRTFLGWCRERELLAHPAVLVGFMSGGFFWPKDRGEGNLFADEHSLARCAAYFRRAAEAMAPFHDTMLAVDLGNELNCVPDSWSAPPAAVRRWSAAMAAAIRSAYPQALVVSGLDSGPIFHDNGWRLGDLPGLDFLSVHTYPVPNWNVVPFDGMTDPFCQAILPFNTRMARAFGPVMAQEFSTILMCGAPECDAYLRGMVPACRDAGANGFLWWCLRDIRTDRMPYAKHGFEGRLGLVGADDRVKPNLRGMMELFREFRDAAPARPAAGDLGLYRPRQWYKRDNPQNPGNDPTACYRRMLAAHYALGALGRTAEIVRGDQPIPAGIRTLVITGHALLCEESAALEAWMRQGGRLIWSGPTWSQWDTSVDAVLGAQPVDIRTPRPVTVECFGERWTLAHYPSDGRCTARVTTARVVAAADDGQPMVLANTLGKGRSVTVLAQPEETMLAAGADRAARDRWQKWYGGLLEEAEP